MRLATIRDGSVTSAARVEGDEYHVLPFRDVREVFDSHTGLHKARSVRATRIVGAHDVDLAPLVPRPEKIICVGLNYSDHAAETGQDEPEYPTLFAKYARSLIGARDNITLPAASTAVDWEVELGVVIGRTAKNVSLEESWDAIAGYTVVNDVSMRDWQARTPQWLQGKTFESSTPIGPHLVTPDEIDHARDLALRCEVDGEVVQSSRTSMLIFSPAQIVSYVSTFITLVPGDIIATGTPGGIGAVQDPPRFLTPQQFLTSTIEGIGTLTNRCVSA